jgi:hypothetical protein
LNQELGFVSYSDSNGFNTLCEVLDADPDKDNPNVFPVELTPDVAKFWPRRQRGIGAAVRVVFSSSSLKVRAPSSASSWRDFRNLVILLKHYTRKEAL